jgi:hypothetical protein
MAGIHPIKIVLILTIILVFGGVHAHCSPLHRYINGIIHLFVPEK